MKDLSCIFKNTIIPVVVTCHLEYLVRFRKYRRIFQMKVEYIKINFILYFYLNFRVKRI